MTENTTTVAPEKVEVQKGWGGQSVKRVLHITVELIDRLPDDVAAPFMVCCSAGDGHGADREIAQNRLESQSKSIPDRGPPLKEF